MYDHRGMPTSLEEVYQTPLNLWPISGPILMIVSCEKYFYKFCNYLLISTSIVNFVMLVFCIKIASLKNVDT